MKYTVTQKSDSCNTAVNINDFSASERFWEIEAKKFTITKLKDAATFRFINKLCILHDWNLKVPKLMPNFLQVIKSFQKKYKNKFLAIPYTTAAKYLGCSIPTICTIIKSAIALNLITADTSHKIHRYGLNKVNYSRLLESPVNYFDNLRFRIAHPNEYDNLPQLSELASELAPPLSPEIREQPFTHPSPKIEMPIIRHSTELPVPSVQLKNLSLESSKALPINEDSELYKNLNKNNINYIVCKIFLLILENKEKNKQQEEDLDKDPKSNQLIRVSYDKGLSAAACKDLLREKAEKRKKEQPNVLPLREDIKSLILGFERAYNQLYQESQGKNNIGLILPLPAKINPMVTCLLNRYSSDRVSEALAYAYTYLETSRKKVKNIFGLISDCIRKWDEWRKNIHEYQNFKIYAKNFFEEWAVN